MEDVINLTANDAAKNAPAEASPNLPTPADPMLALIQQVVIGGGSIENLQLLLDMKERVDRENARKAFQAALAAAQAEIPTVIKNRQNNHTRSSYADLAAIEQAVTPVITSHGISVRFHPVRSEVQGHYGVECVLSHAAGHTETYRADVPSDGAGISGSNNKTPTHAFGSTMTYGRRYLLCMLFNISTGDDDDGNARTAPPVELVTEEQWRELEDLIPASGLKTDVILKKYNIAELANLPAKEYVYVRNRLKGLADERKAKAAPQEVAQ